MKESEISHLKFHLSEKGKKTWYIEKTIKNKNEKLRTSLSIQILIYKNNYLENIYLTII